MNRHLIITVHGIRTFGQWQERLERLLKERQPDIEVFNYKYGYLSVIAFIIPFLRWKVTSRFQHKLLRVVRKQSWNRIDIVAHSFGTHLVAKGLLGIAEADRPQIHTIIFAGSVLKSKLNWDELLDGWVGRV